MFRIKNNIKAVAALGLLIAGWLHVGAQRRPQTTQYVLNYFLSNPAMTGLENYADIRIGHRRQWSGIEGAPVTTWVTANLPLGYTVEQAPPLSLPEEDDRETFFKLLPVERHHGIGLIAYQDKIGPYVSNCFNLSYAWHVPLTDDIALSAGLSAGFQQLRYDPSKNIYPDQPLDPAVLSDFGTKTSPDLNAGIMLYSGRFFAGASAQQLIQSKFINTQNSLSTYARQYILSGGYNIMLNEDDNTQLLISGMVRSDFANPAGWDINAKCMFASTFWVGASYRHQDAVSGMAGLHVARNFNLSYAYDHTLSPLKQFSNGSHEIMLALQIFKFNERVGPRVNW
jgi:type IX secretion system PorP/SprF family membrane protein